MNRQTLALLFLILCPTFRINGLLPESWFPQYHAHNAFELKNYDTAQELLEKEQVEHPNDPEINYNLGNIYYKKKDYDKAQESFGRAAWNSTKDQLSLKEQSLFNGANSYYKNALDYLGPDWEKKEQIPQPELAKAQELATQAIEKYKKALVVTPINKRTQTNLKAAEQLIAQLEKKQMQQQQQKQEQKEQDKQDKKEQGQEQQAQKQQGKEGDEQEGMKKEAGEEGDQEKQESGESSKDEKEQQAAQMPQAKEQQEQAQESMKKKGVQVLLDSLQADENKLQKMLVMQKTKVNQKPTNSYQKPW